MGWPLTMLGSVGYPHSLNTDATPQPSAIHPSIQEPCGQPAWTLGRDAARPGYLEVCWWTQFELQKKELSHNFGGGDHQMHRKSGMLS